LYNSIAEIIGTSLQNSFGVSTEVALTFPSDPLHGDLTTNVCMQVSTKVGKAPREIAEVLIRSLSTVEDIESIDIAGPGFLNITLTIAARLKQLLRVQAACEPQETRDEDPVIVEYSHPNIAKPLGVHHIISTVLGQSIANVYRHCGFNVLSWNYIGDWGTQFGKLAVAVQKWGEDKPTTDYTVEELLDLYVRFHEEAEKDSSLEDEGRKAFLLLEQGDKNIRAFWKDVVKITLEDLAKIYKRLHISFDVTKGESPYEDLMQPIIEEGKRKKIFVKGKQGALVVQFSEESNLPTFMIVKGDGASLYSTRDLALARDRKENYHAQMVLHVVDVAQQLYFQQVFATMEKLEWNMKHEEHVVHGRMSFPDKSMSTRKGNVLRLEDALNEAVERADQLIAEKESEISGKEREELAEMIGVGAFVYTILSQNRKQNMVFTWEKALTFEGNSGPYLQYTYARARSVLRKAGMDRNQESVLADLTLHSLENHEMLLMRHMAKFPEVLEEARKDAMPHKLASFLYELCQSYNSFYSSLPIVKAHEPNRSLRLALSNLTADILRCGAHILTIQVPDRM
jgi:arginyl-tRNA synthetase